MTTVTVGLSTDELESLDAWAFAEHDGDRDEAVQALLDDWLDVHR